eukprot:m.174882 g.174882  ORF g.174882 m.174882 type:complete len:214 (-) comp16760_c0_seq1:88-729(-)
MSNAIYQVVSGGKDVRIQQTDDVDCIGTTIWEASEALLAYFNTNIKAQRLIDGKRVLELGAGCGLLGIGLSLLGASVTLTDVDDSRILANLSRNVRMNQHDDVPTSQTTQVIPLTWACQTHIAVLPAPYDLVVASDVVYKESDVPPLVATLEALVPPNGLAMVTNEDRNHVATELFFSLLSNGFKVKKLALSKLPEQYRHDTVYTLHLRRKRS